VNESFQPDPKMRATAPPPGSTRSLPCSWHSCTAPAYARVGIVRAGQLTADVRAEPHCIHHVQLHFDENYLSGLWDENRHLGVLVIPIEGFDGGASPPHSIFDLPIASWALGDDRPGGAV